MKICVKLFAAAKELAGCDALQVEIAESATVADVRRAVEAAVPALSRVLPHAQWAVDAEYADDNVPVHERSEVAIIPPVSGG